MEANQKACYTCLDIFNWLFWISLFVTIGGGGVIKLNIKWTMIIGSYTLDSGIGYVWIFRVFLLIMLVTPLLQRINVKMKNKYIFVLFLLCGLYIQYILAICSFGIENTIIKTFLQNYIMCLCGYSLLFLLGLRLGVDNNQIFWILISVFAFTIGLGGYLYLNGLPIKISPIYKYPPYAYYLLYGMIASILLWYFQGIYKKIADNRFILFVAQNTCWIYLWHIPLLQVCGIFNSWVLRYFLVYGLAILLYVIQRRLVFCIIRRPSMIHNYLA